jgi:hypothetical protein
MAARRRGRKGLCEAKILFAVEGKGGWRHAAQKHAQLAYDGERRSSFPTIVLSPILARRGAIGGSDAQIIGMLGSHVQLLANASMSMN